MAFALLGKASWGSRLKTVGYYMTVQPTKGKDTIIKVLDPLGLFGINTIILAKNGDRVCNALRILGNAANYPIYMHCSHGKDRTGLICALALWVAGVGLDAICADYHLSEAYGQTAEAKHIFQEHSPLLNLDTWTKAPVAVMQDTFQHINDVYGGVEAYLDRIGFHSDDRRTLKAALGCDARVDFVMHVRNQPLVQIQNVLEGTDGGAPSVFSPLLQGGGAFR